MCLDSLLFITGQGHISEITRYFSYSEDCQHKATLVLVVPSIAVGSTRPPSFNEYAVCRTTFVTPCLLKKSLFDGNPEAVL